MMAGSVAQPTAVDLYRLDTAVPFEVGSAEPRFKRRRRSRFLLERVCRGIVVYLLHVVMMPVFL